MSFANGSIAGVTKSNGKQRRTKVLGSLFESDHEPSLASPGYLTKHQEPSTKNLFPHEPRRQISRSQCPHHRGLGFLGSNLAIKLVQYGANVTLLDSLIPQFGGNYFNISPVRQQVRINISDMRDPNSLDVLVQGQDYIFNLAGR